MNCSDELHICNEFTFDNHIITQVCVPRNKQFMANVRNGDRVLKFNTYTEYKAPVYEDKVLISPAIPVTIDKRYTFILTSRCFKRPI